GSVVWYRNVAGRLANGVMSQPVNDVLDGFKTVANAVAVAPAAETARLAGKMDATGEGSVTTLALSSTATIPTPDAPTRSGRPSRLRSADVMTPPPDGKLTGARNVPSPFPSRMPTEVPSSVATRSTFPSRLKSTADRPVTRVSERGMI